MIAWWPGDGNADDIVGGSPGAAQGLKFASGQVEQAFSLDGTDAVELGNASPLRVSSADFSVEAWVLFNSHQGDMSIVDKMSASGVNTDGWRLLKQADDRFWFCFGGGTQNGCTFDPASSVYSTTPVVSGVWFHVVAIKTSTSFALYVNGKREDARSALPPFVDSNSADLLLGSYLGEGAHLDGLIDEVKLFNRALTPSEVFASFSAGMAGECKGPVPPPPGPAQGAVTFSIGQSIALVNGMTCPVAHTYRLGGVDPVTQLIDAPSAASPGQSLTSGENGSTISCSVTSESGHFDFSGSLHAATDDGELISVTFANGVIGPDFTGTADVSVYTPDLPDGFSSPASVPCRLQVLGQQVKAGSLWASLSCPQIASPPSGLCGVLQASAVVFENCSGS